jgi:predicted transcriptional regulator
MEKRAKAGGGGRLGRTETVTIRLDPKLNYIAELAARAQRRTKSSLIEAALADALNVIRIDPRPSASNQATFAQLGEQLWHVDEPERLRRLVEFAPHLMTFEEQKIWAVMTKNSNFWFGEWRELDAESEFYLVDCSPGKLWMNRVELSWDVIKKVAAGELTPDQLPTEPGIRSKMGPKNPPSLLANSNGN